MKPTKSRLYDALGELYYAIAKSNGKAHQIEYSALMEKLSPYSWAYAVQWSFNYEFHKGNTIEEVYGKAIDTCKAYGPTEEYAFLIEAIENSNTMEQHTKRKPQLIDRFQEELISHFRTLDL